MRTKEHSALFHFLEAPQEVCSKCKCICAGCECFTPPVGCSSCQCLIIH